MYKTRLKQERELNNLTQENLANTIGLKRGSYSHYETEDDLLPIKYLNLICNYFNLSFDYIFEFTDIKNYSNTIDFCDKNIIGENLKKFRKEKKLTQKELALLLNTTQSVIADYEKGRYFIATPFLYTICKNYYISADYLLGKVDEPKYLK